MMKNEQRKSEEVALTTIASQRKNDHDCPSVRCLPAMARQGSEAAPTDGLCAYVSSYSLGATGEEMWQGGTWLGSEHKRWLSMSSPALSRHIGTVKQSGCDGLPHTKSLPYLSNSVRWQDQPLVGL